MSISAKLAECDSLDSGDDRLAVVCCWWVSTWQTRSSRFASNGRHYSVNQDVNRDDLNQTSRFVSHRTTRRWCLTRLLTLLCLAGWYPFARIEFPMVNINQHHVYVHVVRCFWFQTEDFEFQGRKHSTSGWRREREEGKWEQCEPKQRIWDAYFSWWYFPRYAERIAAITVDWSVQRWSNPIERRHSTETEIPRDTL